MAVIVKNLQSDREGESSWVTVSLTCDGQTRPMTFRRYGNHPHLHDRIDTLDPFAVALLMPAMMRGESLEVEGSLDEILLDSLRGPVQDVLRLLNPRWQKVLVHAAPRKTAERIDLSKGAATAMSGGVDSMHLLRHRLLAGDTPQPYRIRTLVHHHVGAHGEQDNVFHEQYSHAHRIADRVGLPIVGVACSMTDLYRQMPFVVNAALRNIAASMAIDHLFTFFHYASSEPLGGRPTISRFSGIGTLEPQLLPLFNTGAVAWLAFGGGATRLQKTAEVISDERLCADLLVCIRGFRTDRKAVNCGRCYKCARLLLQAEASGRLDAVAPSFDMVAYRAGRSYSILRLLRLALGPARNAVDIDLIKFLDEGRFSFPVWARPGVSMVRFTSRGSHSLWVDRDAAGPLPTDMR